MTTALNCVLSDSASSQVNSASKLIFLDIMKEYGGALFEAYSSLDITDHKNWYKDDDEESKDSSSDHSDEVDDIKEELVS